MGKFRDLTGQTFGRLTVLYRDDDYVSPKGYHSTAWKCRCCCGKETTVRALYLNSGKTVSCGCYKNDYPGHTTHGKSNTRLYTIWSGIKARCYNKNEPAYKYYGSRGIGMCEKWRNSFEAFYNWAQESGYQEDLSIDRIDVDGNYSPENCRWATMLEQQNNKRNNHMITHDGKTMTIRQWSELSGVPYYRLKDRIVCGHWSADKALNTPKQVNQFC